MNRLGGVRRILVVMVLIALLAACGGGGSGNDDGTEATTESVPTPDVTLDGGESGSDGGGGEGTEADLEQAATDMFVAFQDGDDQAYFNYLSARCRDELGFASVDDHLSGRRLRANGADIDIASLTVDSVEITGFTGDRAFVALDLGGTSELFEESVDAGWVYEDDGWHRDECANFTPPQGGLEGFGTDRNDPVGYGFVADIGGWLMTVSWITPNDEELVVELGGEPAADGNQLFNIQLNPYYNGSEESTVMGEDLAFAMVNGDTVYGDEADCAGTDPSFYDPTVEVGPGDDVGFIFLCREVAAEDADGMLLRVTDLSSGTDFWFDLTPQ